MKPEVSIDIPAVALPQSQQGLSPFDKDHSLTIRNWDEADRPREKLSARGADSLTPAELLAILIGSGTPQESATVVFAGWGECQSLSYAAIKE